MRMRLVVFVDDFFAVQSEDQDKKKKKKKKTVRAVFCLPAPLTSPQQTGDDE